MNANTAIPESPRHVLFLVDQICEMGGAERMLLNTIRLLPKARYRCSLITFRTDATLDIFNHFPCPYFIFPLRRTYDWNAMLVALKLRSFIQRENVEIIHTFFETADLWGGLISKVSGGRILISSRRDMGILRSTKHRWGYRAMNPLFDLVLTVSEEVRRFCIKEDRIRPDKVVTLYNGLDLRDVSDAAGFSEFINSFDLSPSSKFIVTLGHIRRVKGIDILVDTAAIVAKVVPDAVFLVVGRNSEPQHVRELQTKIAALGIQRQVRFLGEVDSPFPILKLCDIFFLPSRSEGFSNALVEAMACGLPCVATRVGGNSEALHDGHTGYLFESEDAKTAADRIVSLLRDPASARKMGQAGKRTVEQKFTAEVMIEQLVAHYDRLVAEG